MISEKRIKKYQEIEKSIERISSRLDKLIKKSSIVGWWRVSIFLIGIIAFFTLYILSFNTLSISLLILLLICFIAVSILQSKVLTSIKKYKAHIQIKRYNLARAKLDWQNIPNHKTFVESEITPVEIDLDLTGNRSLHQLMDVSKSTEGSLLLRRLMTEIPGSVNEIMERQNLVKELVSLSHFRNKFLLVSSLSSTRELNANLLVNWLAGSDKSSTIKKKLNLLWTLCIANLLFIILAITGIISSVYLITLFIYLSFYYLNLRHVKSLDHDLDRINDEMKKIIGIISFIEEYNFCNKKNVTDLCKPLTDKEKSPSEQLKRINRVLSLLSFRNNPVIWFFVILTIPIEYLLTYRVEIYKKSILKNFPEWLNVWHKLEAFISIANFASLNPDYTFPEITINTQGENKLKLIVKNLGHPLLPHKNKICNDYSIDSIGSISIITGSNMSGKSTFLRTVGINMCLAYVGAPVNADFFSSRFVRLFTCIRLNDSVIDGISYFYAEVKRLRNLLDTIEENDKPPVLFIIDEIFKGTNNIERLKGSKALIKLLSGKRGAGLISTHDLELVKLAGEITSIENYHFREEVENEKMLFDYKLRIGPCPTTNALKIIKLNGLPVE